MTAPPAEERPNAYEITNLRVQRGSGDTAFHLFVPRMIIRHGEKIALVGPSGCGKSTLLEMLALTGRAWTVDRFLMRTEHSTVDVRTALMEGKAAVLAELRGRNIGCLPQSGALLGFATVGRNVVVSRKLLGLGWDKTVDRLLERLGIASHIRKLPGQLSAGERQRVALARALAHRPAILVADEPTATLDPDNADAVMGLIDELVVELGVTAILATHDRERVERFRFVPVPFSVGFDPRSGGRTSICLH